MNLTDEQKKELAKLFPFEYVGGGYFRKKGVKKGTTAQTLHGKEAIEYMYSNVLDVIFKFKAEKALEERG
jgi:hypothetical protein